MMNNCQTKIETGGFVLLFWVTAPETLFGNSKKLK
jgi:hypothetical protein